jgi:D-alanyl-D-alanine-carboxypeptidase/D-alanyl-D-alanine-endopeptidase
MRKREKHSVHKVPRAVRVPFLLIACASCAERAAVTIATSDFPSDSAVLAIIRRRVEEKRSAGIVIGMLDSNGHSRVVAFGDPGAGHAALDGNTVFEIGSISKVFTATVLAELVQEGKLSLSDPAQKFLPPAVRMPTHNGKEITLGNLAEQNSGLPRMPTNFTPTDPRNPYANYTVEQMYDFLSHYELTRDPGAQFEYSNLGVGLLGHLLSLATGETYAELEHERVWKALGMSHTAIELTPEMKAHMAVGHDEQGNVTENWDIPTLAGAGAIRSTTEDMLKFADANLHPERGPLERAMAFAQRVRAPTDVPLVSIGLNWLTMYADDDTIVWHNGGTGGFRTFIALEPSRRRAVVVMTNSAGEGADDIGMHLLKSSLSLMAKPTPAKARVAIALPPGTLEQYVGSYALSPTFAIKVELRGSALFGRATGQPGFRLWPESENEFFLKEVDAQITFTRDGEGEVTGLVLHQNGLDQKAPKSQ